MFTSLKNWFRVKVLGYYPLPHGTDLTNRTLRAIIDLEGIEKLRAKYQAKLATTDNLDLRRMIHIQLDELRRMELAILDDSSMSTVIGHAEPYEKTNESE